MKNKNTNQNKDKNPHDKVRDVIDAYRQTGKQTDPNGSYTGNPAYSQVPVQDADDL